jgi:hypothetical protein
MNMDIAVRNIRRFDISMVEQSLMEVERNWPAINQRLIDIGIGAKEPPFNEAVREEMVCGYRTIYALLAKGEEPFSDLGSVLEINNAVMYGNDFRLRLEYNNAINATKDRFYELAPAVDSWYKRHVLRGDPPLKLAAEIYVAILGMPQLFIEGNHRSGALISSWINLYFGYPPFVLSEANAIEYFGPSSEIKFFAEKSTWRSIYRLPKYRKSFSKLWGDLVDPRYLI